MTIMRRMILGASELPEVGSGHEHLAIDFKAHAPQQAEFELAKDAAAFANAAGGSIVHRAYEDKTRRVLGRYEPMPPEDAGRVIEVYDHAIRDRCFQRWRTRRARLGRSLVGGTRAP